ncbi:oligosaccharide translocation protein RFT1 [Streptococcus oralis]|jgi:hypothetical protein|uniref:oligosaccharide translocation protein RFT1 n=1 Tax=Streptococcus oralis TaxID=1303 RepID=UPI001CBEC40B|nr:oligosaccharide translocation protein RFT1 [Streptococcus oralis]MBZ2086122.1 oligosaccharide translocation protein RFT1 [Streptococcus oralis]MBZ2089699.1 oligosaccharide translocation protein RFT1 [Streptococcus oralis]
MILERIKKTFEFQRSKIKGPVPLWGVLNGIFILYPIAFFMFMAGGLEVLKNEDLYQGLLIAGIVVWVLNLVFLLDLKRGILTSFGTYLMYLTGHIYIIIGFGAMSGDHNFIGLKLSLPLIQSIIVIVVMSCLVDLDSEEVISQKASKFMVNFLLAPPLILSCVCIFLAMFGYEYFWGWGASLLSMAFGQAVYLPWFYIIYAYQHRHDVEEETSIKHIKVNPDMISNREFDRDRFSRKVTKDD